ncbi:hypothetical protein ACH429_15145 [Streptomyces pathocidini]|uniref:Uncharacterized protein n=1 Tax=Streptomyces pathocidini TaxID=1650571 RepID=A0ABW7US29_9ACTN|nr:hypothetical protein [Streptomyces pathocidini]
MTHQGHEVHGHEVFRTAPFPFPGDRFPEGLGAVVQRTVAEGLLPALTVVHDTEGDWLVGDGANDPNLPDACQVHCLAHLAEADPAIAETATLPPGHAAYREGPGSPWVVRPFAYEEEGEGGLEGETAARTAGVGAAP